MKRMLTVAALIVGLSGIMAADAQAGPGKKGRQRQPRRPAPQVTRPVPQAARPAPRVAQPAPRVTRPTPRAVRHTRRVVRPAPPVARPASRVAQPALWVTRPTPRVVRPAHPVARPGATRPQPPMCRHVRAETRRQAKAKERARERQRDMEQARALLRQADDLLCQAAELDLAKNQILTRARALARAMGLRKPLRSALSRKTGRPRVPVTRVGRLFQKARSLAETRESILNQANALWAQAQYLMSKHGYR